MELITRQQVIDKLGVSAGYFSKVVNGLVKGVPAPPCVRIGRRQLFRKDSLEQWILEQESQAGVSGHAARVA